MNQTSLTDSTARTPEKPPMTQDARPVSTHEQPAAWRSAGLGFLAAVGVLGCATLGGNPGTSLVPDRVVTRTGPFAVHTNMPIDATSSPIRQLVALEGDVETNLGFRVSSDAAPVEVYILKDREAFSHFLRFYYPELPRRRAFFLAQGPRRFIYTYENDRLDEDLRHEAAHALLHEAVGDLPLWLDEGLAEYFEGPRDRNGLNPEHVARISDDLKSGWKPDLSRLETLKNIREMSPRDYRESWAWVHYLLKEGGPGKAALLAYLSELRGSPRAVPLSERLAHADQGSAQRILSHLGRIPSNPVAESLARKPATILFQDALIDSAPRGTQKRSMIGRFLSLVGLAARSNRSTDR
ncbi:MAG: hypothetical protein NVSMB9_05420 [Isosphaeraceae bacterium]